MRAIAAWTPALLISAGVAQVTACGGDPRRCGAGTELRDGECVSAVVVVECGEGSEINPINGECEPILTCGAGTHYDDATETCVADARCAEGTTFDAATGRCESQVQCSTGTTFNVVTGACEPTRVCGPGTDQDPDGTCRPIDPCGEGTTFDPDSGTCSPVLVCGEGLAELDGVCRTPAEIAALEHDVTEPLVEANDPAFGGTPEPVQLEPIGEQLVFVGHIGRPLDLDGDGIADQDRDGWAFEGRRGQLLRIRVLDDGLPEPAFVLSGPEGFERWSQIGGVLNGDREVVLPYDGVYTLVVMPALDRAAGYVLGGIGYDYVGIVEELPWPSLRSIVPSPPPAETSQQGTVLGLRDNFFVLEVAQLSAVLVNARVEGFAAQVSLMAFDEAGGFLGIVDLAAVETSQLISLPLAADVVTTGRRTIIIVDWRTSNGLPVDFELGVSFSSAETFASVDVGAPLTLERTVVPAQRFHAFSFTAPAGAIITTHFDGIRPGPLAAYGPAGLVVRNAVLEYGAASFYSSAAGTYTWIYVNDGVIDADLSVGISATAPIIAASAGGAQPTAETFTGDDLRAGPRLFDAVWVAVPIIGPALVRAGVDRRGGAPELDAYRVEAGGGLTHVSKAEPDDPARLQIVAGNEPMVVVRLSGGPAFPPGPPIRGWTIDVSSAGPVGAVESEPNNVLPYEVDDVGQPPLAVRGTLESGDTDVFLFTLEPLQVGEALRITAESVGRAVAPSLAVFDATRTELHRRSLATSRYANTWYLFALEGSLREGPFFVTLSGDAEPLDYLFTVERISMPAEIEPNQPRSQARHLGTLVPGQEVLFYGNVAGEQIAPDFFELSLSGGSGGPANGLPAGEALSVRTRALSTSTTSAAEDDLHLTLWDITDPANEVIVTTTQGSQAELLINPGAAGPYVLELSGEGGVREDQYELILEVLPGVDPGVGVDTLVEVEPNDTQFISTWLDEIGPGESVSVLGIDQYLGTDIYRAAALPGQPLGVREAVSVRWAGLLGGVDLAVTILEADGTPVVSNRARSGELIVGSTGGGSGVHYLQIVPVTPSAQERLEPYELTVARYEAIPDREPNDDEDHAQLIGAVPAVIRAMSRDLGPEPADPDVYELTLDRNLGANEELRVRAEVVYTLHPLTVTLRDGNYNVLATAQDAAVEVSALPPDPSDGANYYVEILSSLSEGGKSSVYEATIDILSR